MVRFYISKKMILFAFIVLCVVIIVLATMYILSVDVTVQTITVAKYVYPHKESVVTVCEDDVDMVDIYNQLATASDIEMFDGTQIPKIIHQTWSSNTMFTLYGKAVQSVRDDYQDVTHLLSDDHDCNQMIEVIGEYIPGLVQSYKSLVPGAFKADLYRLAVVWYTGGLYLDICFNTGLWSHCTTRLQPRTDLLLCEDIIPEKALYQAIFGAKKNHPAILYTLNQIIVDVLARREPVHHVLEVTGPYAFKVHMTKFFQDVPGTRVHMISHMNPNRILDKKTGDLYFLKKFMGWRLNRVGAKRYAKMWRAGKSIYHPLRP